MTTERTQERNGKNTRERMKCDNGTKGIKKRNKEGVGLTHERNHSYLISRRFYTSKVLRDP
jgi:hypothetical protein